MRRCCGRHCTVTLHWVTVAISIFEKADLGYGRRMVLVQVAEPNDMKRPSYAILAETTTTASRSMLHCQGIKVQ